VLSREVGLSLASLPPLIAGAGSLGLVLYIVAKGATPLRLRFVSSALASSAWSLCIAVSLATQSSELGLWTARVGCASIALLGACNFSLASALVRVRSPIRWPLYVLPSVAAALCLLGPNALVVELRPNGGYWPLPSASIWMAIGAGALPLFYAMYLLRRAAQALPPCRHRRQLDWAFYGMVLATASCLDLNTVFTRGYPLAWLFCALSTAMLFYAVAEHRLVGTRTLIRYALISAVGVFALSIAAAFMKVALPAVHARQGPKRTILFLGMFAVMRIWVRYVEPALSYFFAWRGHRIERSLAEFERRSLSARSTDDVSRDLAIALEDAFDARRIEVLPADRVRQSEHASVAIAETVMAESGAPILRDLIDLEDQRAPRLFDALSRLEADALLPLCRESQLHAVAVVAGDAFFPADDAIAEELRRFGRRGALAWVNARLYHEVARRSAGLEAQVQARTKELSGALTELQAAQARLLEAERSSSLGLLVAGLSHEIGNALNIISANLPTLSRYSQRYDTLLDGTGGVVDAARKALPQALAELGEATRRTRSIIDDLRRFARPDTERRLVRVQEGLDSALNLLRRRTDGRLDVVRLYSGTPSVEGYPGQLNQCFFNLLLYAIEDAKSEISVSLGCRDSGDGIALVIRNDAETELADEPGRVGLSVARAIVERHGGTFDVSNTDGRGAILRLTLPQSAPEPLPR
jgi:signal transduction histidine kinase